MIWEVGGSDHFLVNELADRLAPAYLERLKCGIDAAATNELVYVAQRGSTAEYGFSEFAFDVDFICVYTLMNDVDKQQIEKTISDLVGQCGVRLPIDVAWLSMEQVRYSVPTIHATAFHCASASIWSNKYVRLQKNEVPITSAMLRAWQAELIESVQRNIARPREQHDILRYGRWLIKRYLRVMALTILTSKSKFSRSLPTILSLIQLYSPSQYERATTAFELIKQTDFRSCDLDYLEQTLWDAHATLEHCLYMREHES